MTYVGFGFVHGGGSRAKNPSEQTVQNNFFFSILVHCNMYEMYSVIESSKDTKKNAY